MKLLSSADWLRTISNSIKSKLGINQLIHVYPSNVKIGSDVQMAQGVIIRGSHSILIDRNCMLHTGVCLDATNGPISIGSYCVLGHHTQLNSSGVGIVIGTDTIIGADADFNASGGYVYIGNKCTIGAHVSIRGDGKGVNISSECKIGLYSTLDTLGGEITFGEKSVLGNNCMVVGSGRGVHIQSNCDFHNGVFLDAQGGFIEIDSFSGAGPYSIIYGHGGMTIGKYCAIAGQTVLIPANHRFDRLDIPIRQQGLTAIGISVGDDVWIGTQCVILDGAVIGNGCIIGAGSIIKGSIENNSVVAGNPYRIIKTRI
jgi:acetyltransferase-like isoleucine patch superfamily enzyme